jgi:drug/metabolite transporter (DMT)-like permease
MVIAIYLLVVSSSITQSASAKWFNRQSQNAATFNAIVAASALLLFALMAINGFSIHVPTILFGLLYGASLCLSMYAGYRALCLGPMALTSMLVSFSVLIPLLWGITVGNEKLNFLRCIAILLLLAAILLTNADKILRIGAAKAIDGGKKEKYGTWIVFVVLTFLCNGVCSVLQKQHQTLYPEAYSQEFMLWAMLLCTVIFSAVSLIKTPAANVRSTKGAWLGVLSGVANGLANFLTLILAGLENASVLFPMISAGTLLGAILCGRILFKEKLRLNHYFALAFGMLAVVLFKI